MSMVSPSCLVFLDIVATYEWDLLTCNDLIEVRAEGNRILLNMGGCTIGRTPKEMV